MSLILMNVCLYVTRFTPTLSPESPGVSLMIFAWWFYERFKHSGNLLPVFICGIMLDLLTGFKPYMEIFFVIIGIAVLTKNSRASFAFTVRSLFLLCIVMAITTSLLTWRNYQFNKEIVPLTKELSGVHYSRFVYRLAILEADWRKAGNIGIPAPCHLFF